MGGDRLVTMRARTLLDDTNHQVKRLLLVAIKRTNGLGATDSVGRNFDCDCNMRLFNRQLDIFSERRASSQPTPWFLP